MYIVCAYYIEVWWWKNCNNWGLEYSCIFVVVAFYHVHMVAAAPFILSPACGRIIMNSRVDGFTTIVMKCFGNHTGAA